MGRMETRIERIVVGMVVTMQGDPITVLVDDEHLARERLRVLVEGQLDMLSVGALLYARERIYARRSQRNGHIGESRTTTGGSRGSMVLYGGRAFRDAVERLLGEPVRTV